MSRLIDADVMHREIDKHDPEGRMSLKNIKIYIDVQPTAYDIDKVVEQLWELQEDVIQHGREVDRVGEVVEEAIEIVRKGGVK